MITLKSVSQPRLSVRSALKRTTLTYLNMAQMINLILSEKEEKGKKIFQLFTVDGTLLGETEGEKPSWLKIQVK